MNEEEAINLAYTYLKEDYYSGSSVVHSYVEEDDIVELIKTIYASINKTEGK